MLATIPIQARIPAARLKKVRGILASMGTDTSNVINMVFAQIERDRRLPVEITGHTPAEDGYVYAWREYGLTREEMDSFDASMDAEIEESRRNGTFREIT